MMGSRVIVVVTMVRAMMVVGIIVSLTVTVSVVVQATSMEVTKGSGWMVVGDPRVVGGKIILIGPIPTTVWLSKISCPT